MLQGEYQLPKTTDYWNEAIDKAICLPILTAMSMDRWHQLKRYLKISNLITDLDSSGLQWYTKLKPLYSDFINSSQTYMVSGRDVSVNEQLILFKGRSRCYSSWIRTGNTYVDSYSIYSRVAYKSSDL